jgi:hypothetical protein
MGRRLAWVGLAAVAVAGIAWMIAAPGDVSYFFGPFATVPLAIVSIPFLDDLYDRATRRQLVGLWFAALGLAVAGAAWALVAPGERSFVVGSLMAMPVVVATVLLGRDDESEGSTDSGLGGAVYGPPPF